MPPSPPTDASEAPDAGALCPAGSLAGQRVRFAGRLIGMTRREAQRVVERHGGVVVEQGATLVVRGETAGAGPIEPGAAACDEADLWRRLGLVGDDTGVERLYTTAMLAGLVGAPVAAVRRWSRRGVLRPTRRLERLEYFDFVEAMAARRLGALLAAGRSMDAIDRIADALHRAYPHLDRPLVELPLVVEGGRLLVRRGAAVVEPGGQRRIDFDAPAAEESAAAPIAGRIVPAPSESGLSSQPAGAGEPDPRVEALSRHDAGDLPGAVAAWRIVLLTGGGTAEDQFALAELLYEAGEPHAARERYYAALEADGDYVEARVNLGCVLRELGDTLHAVAAFRGAIEAHEAYPDAHYHLAATLAAAGDFDAARRHWERFLEIAPESPWAEEARRQLADADAERT